MAESIGNSKRVTVPAQLSFSDIRMRTALAEGKVQTLHGPVTVKVRPETIGLLKTCDESLDWTRGIASLGRANQGPGVILSGGRSFLAWQQYRTEIDKMQAASPAQSPEQGLFRKCELIAKYKTAACRESSELATLYLLEQMRCGRLPANTIIHQVKVRGIDHAQTLVGSRQDFANKNKSNIAVADPWIETPMAHTLAVSGSVGFQLTDDVDFDSGTYTDTGERFLLASFGEAVPEVGAAFVKVEAAAGQPSALKGGETAHLKLGPGSERLSLAGRAVDRGIWTGGNDALGKTYTMVSYRDKNGGSVSFDGIDLNRYFNKSRALLVSYENNFFLTKQNGALPTFDTRFDYKDALERLTKGRPRKLLVELARTPAIASEMFRDLVGLGISSRSARVRACTSMLETLLKQAERGGHLAAGAQQMFASIVNDAVAACRAGREDDRCILAAAARVLTQGVSPAIFSGIGGITPVYAATLAGDMKLVERLCARGESATKATADGDTPLALALRTEMSGVAKTLLGMDAVAGPHLLKAVESRDEKPLLVLLDHGANMDAPGDTEGCTALQAALKAENYDAAYLLLRRGASPFKANETGRTALHFAAMGNDEFVVADLVRNGGDINQQDAGGISALHLAAMSGKAKVLKSVMNQRPDVNVIDAKGNAPLHLAVRHGQHAAIESLLIRKANLSIKNADGKTPLDLAVESADAVAVRLLGGSPVCVAASTAETV